MGLSQILAPRYATKMERSTTLPDSTFIYNIAGTPLYDGYQVKKGPINPYFPRA